MRRLQSAHVNTRRLRKAKGILLAAAMPHKSRGDEPAEVRAIDHRCILQKHSGYGVRTVQHPVSKIISVNVGLPREVLWHGHTVTTGIFKEPVERRVFLGKLDLDGDRQADLTVHGGEYKAVYCYPVEHYAYWKKELPGYELTEGNFGENFTTEGLLEDAVHLGDQFSIGSAEVVVTQPRLPCYKLGIRFQSDAMVKRFLASKCSGFYFAVMREGEVGAGDEIKEVSHGPNHVSISEINRLYLATNYTDADIEVLRRALQVAAFPESWKEHFRSRLPD
jgi:MOSC domain-containing protein YiiM